MRVIVVGAGIVGVASAFEMAKRGHDVTLLDAGAIPHPDASSTDISKVVRLDYGDDEFYVELMERALPVWRAYNAEMAEPAFHETGFLLLTRRPMAPGSFEHACYRTLTARGHELERLDAEALSSRFPAWRRGRFVDGYLNRQGGWAESSRVVQWLVERAASLGVDVRADASVAELRRDGARVAGVTLRSGERVGGEMVIVSAGAWTPMLVPAMSDRLTVVAQPVLHFAPTDPRLFEPPAFRTWAADIAETGWYGFPVNGDGIVKVANHGPGIPIDATAERRFPVEAEERCRVFLREALPLLAEAPIVGRRLCLYADSSDGDFWIDRVPGVDGLMVATGGSGHAFKLGPMLGRIVAEVVDGGRPPAPFQWRPPRPGREQARRHDSSHLADTH